MGAPEQLLPAGWSDAQRLVGMLDAFNVGRNADGPALMHALTHHALPLDDLLPTWTAAPAQLVFARVVEAFVRRWLGASVSEQLGVQRNSASYLIPILRPLSRSLSALLTSQLLGGESRTTERQIALAHHLLDATNAPAQPLSPAGASHQPA